MIIYNSYTGSEQSHAIFRFATNFHSCTPNFYIVGFHVFNAYTGNIEDRVHNKDVWAGYFYGLFGGFSNLKRFYWSKIYSRKIDGKKKQFFVNFQGKNFHNPKNCKIILKLFLDLTEAVFRLKKFLLVDEILRKNCKK